MKVDIKRTTPLLDDFFRVDEVFVRFEKFDGSMSEPVRRLVLDRGDAVAALVRNTATGRLVLARQFRLPTHAKGPGWPVEVIAGLIDAGEQPEAAIRREIHEEAALEVTKLEPISTFYVTPGGSNERVFLFYAEAAPSAAAARPDPEEDIELIDIGLEDALKQVGSGEIADAKTIIALWWLRAQPGPPQFLPALTPVPGAEPSR